MLKKHAMLTIFCLLSIFLGGCAKIKVHIQFQDRQTCQNFCQSTIFFGNDTTRICKTMCQKEENTQIEIQKSIEPSKKYFKKATKRTDSTTVQSQETAECNKICTSLWPTNNQEKTTCTTSCQNL